MKIQLYSVRDTKSAFSQPIPCPNDEYALRQFIGSVRAESPNLCNVYPEDKEFWKLGELDDQTGEFTKDLRLIAKAETYVIENKTQEERQ